MFYKFKKIISKTYSTLLFFGQFKKNETMQHTYLFSGNLIFGWLEIDEKTFSHVF